uniref:G-protein coupled receptors family 2 profile 2 domain-containing protein n=1 Tax=Biomphalaria glabrata TaxID=6526 RepID=A0A2C9KVE1_BIOGL
MSVIFESFQATHNFLVAKTLNSTTLYRKTLSHSSYLPLTSTNETKSRLFDEYINISLLLQCRYVHFDSISYKLNVDYRMLPPHVFIEIDLSEVILYITDQRDLKMVDVDEDGGLNVCVELLDKLIGQQQQSFLSLMAKWLKGTNLVEYILSLVCFVASIICLILTLLTYVICPVLRTEAGINNMFLSGSLLLAQVSLLFSSHSVRASTLCTALGVLTHFLWLWNFTWSFICSYHMYKVFASNLRRSTTVQPRKLWITVICSILFPIIIIVTTVVFNFLKFDGRDIGYGLSVCYLNTAFLV